MGWGVSPEGVFGVASPFRPMTGGKGLSRRLGIGTSRLRAGTGGRGQSESGQVMPSASTRGNPAKVIVSTPFTMLPIVGVATITLHGEATMRIEQDASRYSDADTYTPGACP